LAKRRVWGGLLPPRDKNFHRPGIAKKKLLLSTGGEEWGVATKDPVETDVLQAGKNIANQDNKQKRKVKDQNKGPTRNGCWCGTHQNNSGFIEGFRINGDEGARK